MPPYAAGLHRERAGNLFPVWVAGQPGFAAGALHEHTKAALAQITVSGKNDATRGVACLLERNMFGPEARRYWTSCHTAAMQGKLWRMIRAELSQATAERLIRFWYCTARCFFGEVSRSGTLDRKLVRCGLIRWSRSIKKYQRMLDRIPVTGAERYSDGTPIVTRVLQHRIDKVHVRAKVRRTHASAVRKVHQQWEEAGFQVPD